MNPMVRLNTLKGSRSDNERHMIARLALYSAIGCDPRWIRLIGSIRLPAKSELEDFMQGLDASVRVLLEDMNLPVTVWMKADLILLAVNFVAYPDKGTVLDRVLSGSGKLAGFSLEGEAKQYKKPTEHTVTHVEWFYRAAIRKPPESISAIARESQRDRKSVRQGISDAKHLLFELHAEPIKPH